jgi:membrane glycosyltransferase
METVDQKQLNTNAQWEKSAWQRRLVLSILILSTTAVASSYMAGVIIQHTQFWLEILLVIFFGLLFAWISVGFWSSMMGFIILWRRYDRFSVTDRDYGASREIDKACRTAILIPIYNENVTRVVAGLRAIFLSLKQTGQCGQFDFFLLSDSIKPGTWILEETAWMELCQELTAFGQIFYRHRRPNIKRKSGNIADFCRRWGRNYRYMIVLDADSLMSGETLVKMVKRMETNPNVGILQTVPVAMGHHTLLARVQQFANRLYGLMFAAGMHYWQLGDAHYWGHNAILRVAPFMEHCGLQRLPGKPPLGGDILSHDFVEAALMRRAGWSIWLAYDLGGSWEEIPPNLIDELSRDRRWCQGNLQHLRLIFSRGIFPAHRILFLNGAMAYFSALLWLIFITLSTTKAVLEVILPPVYFPKGRSLFPQWPVWEPGWALILLSSTLLILFLPKLLSFVLVTVRQRQGALFGGGFKLLLSMCAEIVISTLLAPIRMLAHSKFVFITLIGKKITWNPPPREENSTQWKQAWHFHCKGMFLAALWAVSLFFLNRSFFWWLSPILIPLIFSVPLSVWTSRIDLGQQSRRLGLFLTPDELKPSREILVLDEYARRHGGNDRASFERREDGFVRAVIDPQVAALHLALRRGRRKLAAPIAERRHGLVQKALHYGPGGLRRDEKMELLTDPSCLCELHQLVWELPKGDAAQRWGL